ncbi:unnamed protein product, partial [Adineta steineri]
HIRPPYQQQSRLLQQQQQQLQPRQQVSLPAPLQRHRLLQPRQLVLQQPVRLRQQVPQLVRHRQQVPQPVRLRQQVRQPPVQLRQQVLQQQVLRHPRVQHQRQRQRQVLQNTTGHYYYGITKSMKDAPETFAPQRDLHFCDIRSSISTVDLEASTSTTTTTTAPACGTYPSSPPGQILSNFPKGAAKTVFPLTTYTQYTSTFTASSTLATLSFIILGEGGGGAVHYWLIDDVVANHTNANANVLINGDFETGNLNGWTQYCNTTTNCDAGSTGNYGHTVPTGSGPCYSGSYCVFDSCKNTDYLEQSFSTVIGDYYIISYYIRNGNNNDAGPLAMYVTLT